MCRNATTLPPPPSGEHPVPRSRQRWVEECPSCEGRGETLDVDYDDGDKRLILVTCEYCDGSGELANCVACDEIMPAPEAERNAFLCGGCVERLNGRDAEDETAELRRAG
jgi:RecJ-like exonuclease